MNGRDARTAQDPVVRTLRDLPRTSSGRISVDLVAAALAPCDVLESPPGRGWSTIVPHGGAQLIDDGHRSRLHQADGAVVDLGPDPFTAINTLTEQLGVTPGAARDPALPAVAGGLIGAFAYDLGRRVEQVPVVAAADRPQHHLHLRVADVVVAIAPDRDRAVVAAVPAPLSAAPAATLVADVTARLRTAADRADPLRDEQQRGPAVGPQTVTTSMGRDAHRAATQAVLDAISAGEVFQVNIAQRLTARWPADTSALYRALRDQSPAPFGALLPEAGIASISPETFLSVDGSHVHTRPIKGTRPRAADAALDAAMADDLTTSSKDRAEHVMVVDIERNDLGRVCRPGSVRVPQLTALEAHPTVWHLVSTVEGELRDGVGFGDLLRATFPCGSITGAPKVAAMELIEQLEGVRRGWYCGAVGYLAPGSAQLSVAIRTAVLQPDGRVDYASGGGIVADSDPDDEHAETLDKAAAFLRAVQATSVSGDPSAVVDQLEPR